MPGRVQTVCGNPVSRVGGYGQGGRASGKRGAIYRGGIDCRHSRRALPRESRAPVRGSGYVVESLEAALWCFQTTSSFRECVLRAANLGDDADTTAAVAGQLAGAYYGLAAIPEEWRNKLARREEIVAMADGLAP